jgi:threonine/homoserine/homoserine lactone efflux protein
MIWLIAGAWLIFIFWRLKRAKENAAERSASGMSRSPLYWIGVTLAMGVLALSMYMASMNPSEIAPAWWLLVFALFVAALLVRRALCWRFPC